MYKHWRTLYRYQVQVPGIVNKFLLPPDKKAVAVVAASPDLLLQKSRSKMQEVTLRV